MKILFFIGTLRPGSKECRFIELIAGLKSRTDFEILLVLAFNLIDYDYFCDSGINYFLKIVKIIGFKVRKIAENNFNYKIYGTNFFIFETNAYEKKLEIVEKNKEY